MRPMTRLLLAVAALALLAAGCGAAENDPNLAAAAAKNEALGSGRFEAKGTTVAENGEQTPLACSGSADYDGKRVHVRCEYEGRGAFEVIAIRNDFYLRGDGFGFGGDKWVRETGTADGDTSLANLSPQHTCSRC